MEFIKSLKLLTSKYEHSKNGNSFVKHTFQTKLDKFRTVFDVELEQLINNCLRILNSKGQCWNVNVFVQQSYDKALGFSTTPVGEYRYENIYKIEFMSKNGTKTVYLPLLSCRLNAKSKFDYVNNPFPKEIKVNLLDLYYNEKKVEKLYIPLANTQTNTITDSLTDVLWYMIENNSKNLIVNTLLPNAVDNLCALYENGASKEEIEQCKNEIKMYHREISTNVKQEKFTEK